MSSARAGLTLAAALLFVACAAPWVTPPWVCNHDVGWFLHVAGRWLDGDRLYVDVVDVNPPLIVYLSAIPVACARALGISEVLAFHAAVLLAVAVSTVATARVLARLELRLSRAGMALGTWALLYVLIVAPQADFGQREHLMIILALPWAALAAARASGRSAPLGLALLAGAMAGVGLGLKPYFTLAPVLVAGSLWIRVGRRAVSTPENLALACVLAAYAAHFFVLPPDVTAGMSWTFEVAGATYAGYDAPLAAVLSEPLVVECALLGGAALFLPARGDARGLGAVLAWLWLGLLAAALWQHKGWSYHFAGAAAAGRLLLAAVGLSALARRPPAWTAAVTAFLAALTLSGVLERAPGGVRLSRPHAHWLEQADRFRDLADGGPVLVLDTDIAPYFPLLDHLGLPVTSRFACLWPLPGLDAVDESERDRLEGWLRATLLEDVERRPPQLVIVGLPPLFAMEDDFDLLGWLLRDPAFAAVWRDYEPIASADGRAFFRRRS